MHIHIYNPIADKDGQYRLKHLLFLLSIYFCWPIHLLSFLCFALLRLAVIVLLCLLLLYLSMTRSRLSPVLRPPISPGCPFGCWVGELRLGLWRRSATASASASAGFFSFVSSASPLCKCYVNSEQVNNNFHFRHPKQQRTKPGNRSRTWQGY